LQVGNQSKGLDKLRQDAIVAREGCEDGMKAGEPLPFRHIPIRRGHCEIASGADPAVLRVILKVSDSAGGDNWWVESGACDIVWRFALRERSVTTNRLQRRQAIGVGRNHSSRVN
jgi:hypothetical protein